MHSLRYHCHLKEAGEDREVNYGFRSLTVISRAQSGNKRKQRRHERRTLSSKDLSGSWLIDAAAIQRQRQYSPDRTEILARDDRRQDTTSVHTDCTEPPPDS